jgi:hypothetical protein
MTASENRHLAALDESVAPQLRQPPLGLVCLGVDPAFFGEPLVPDPW